ncbi:unnamed protein product [Nyctereutes procyonoides]|uniref:(raccoon dog) hypothetical protein n=1 Tax=Nyctereutes procyonoides TaxID=34880 RepID=A0A811YNX4_NYCPR|nr:unnamed protein product [Nyctereutes procyonoides]
MRNHTELTDFILLGLSDDPQLQEVIFVFLLITYILSITGTLTIITLTLNFSLLEISFTTVSIPKFLGTLITGDKTVSFNDCMAQVCILLVFASWSASFLIIFPSLMLFIQLDYFKSNVIDHFTCDYFPLLHLSCSDTKFLEIVGFSCAVFTLMFTLALIILSYIYILRTILRIPSTSQRTKAFSTCSSHMIVISISYGSCIFMYINPAAKDRVSLSKGVAVLNTSVAPMLNPFIYSLRNQQVKRAFLDRARKIVFFSSK